MLDKREILRSKLPEETIKESYGKIGKFYALAEGIAERGLRKRALELLAIQEGEMVLEIGFGTGYSLIELTKSVGKTGKAYGIDITPEMVEIATRKLEKEGLIGRVEIHEGDAKNMPFEDDVFDAVYMASTLELFDTPDIPKVLREIKRVTKPGGRLGVVSISKDGYENSLFLRFYEWLHKKFPKYVNCRPIYVEASIREAGYHIKKSEKFMLVKLMPERIVIAKAEEIDLI